MSDFRAFVLAGTVVLVVFFVASVVHSPATSPSVHSGRALLTVFRADCRIVRDVRVEPDAEWYTPNGVHFAYHGGAEIVWPACDSDECWNDALDAISGPAFDAHTECRP